MKSNSKWIVLGAALSMMSLSVRAQEQPSTEEAFRMGIEAGVPTDWTH
jgi:hypothetical protein